MVESDSLHKMFELMEEVKEKSFKDSKKAKREMRVAISAMVKLAVPARKDILASMKGE